MQTDLSNTYFIYTSKEVAEKVGIQTPTVRKYAQMLEQQGYRFEKNGDRRNFVDADVVAMMKMKESNDIAKTAKELAELQEKYGSVVNGTTDMKKSDLSVSPPDMALIQQQFLEILEEKDKRYNRMLEIVEETSSEVAATKKQVETIVQELAESKRREEEKDDMIRDMNEKLSRAVDFIMAMEEKNEKEEVKERPVKKSIWKKVFG